MKDKKLTDKVLEESEKFKKLISEGWEYLDTTVTGHHILKQEDTKIIYDSEKDIILKEIYAPKIIEKSPEKKENQIEKNQKRKFSSITGLKKQVETSPYQDSQNIPQKEQPNNYWEKELEKIRNRKEEIRKKNKSGIKKHLRGISFRKEYKEV
jgi:hypothetical protein